MCLVLMQNFIVSPLQCPIDHSSFLQSGFEGHHLKFLSFDISHYKFLQNYQESDYFDKKKYTRLDLIGQIFFNF